MATSYPGGLDDFAEITTQKQSQSVGGRDHKQLHNDLGDAVEAIQADSSNSLPPLCLTPNPHGWWPAELTTE